METSEATAEQIVRALAATDPNVEEPGWDTHYCHLCEASSPTKVASHEPDCPWRLAVQWVQAHNEPSLASAVQAITDVSPPGSTLAADTSPILRRESPANG